MQRMINIGIDLGTTNSLVAEFVQGEVRVHRNSVRNEDTLPSAVMLKRDRMLVGRKALEQAESDPQSVALAFKRKMGTTETIHFKSTDQSLTPVELSSLVLKELRASHLNGRTLDAAVITVPAAFNTVQAAATKQAGELAGIRQVVLLQEPIAASLAYANSGKGVSISEGRWLVYDLGGGTFDAALVEIRDGDMKVLDHEGDNFLGGTDFDRMIVDSLVLPTVINHFKLTSDAATGFTSATGKHRAFYLKALRKAEDAKKELSVQTSAEIEGLNFRATADAEDEPVEAVRFTRSEFEALIRPQIDRTADMAKHMLARNGLSAPDISFVLMVGGSTFVPFVRSRVAELLGISVRTDIDPITAIAAGAAYFAATKTVSDIARETTSAPAKGTLSVKAAYSAFSTEREALFAARVAGLTPGMHYRIKRKDGGFDSGLKPLHERINEDLPLTPDSYNIFFFTVTDSHGLSVENDLGEITISHGKYRVYGQPLTSDICLEIDSAGGETKLFCVHRKGTVLPAKRSTSLTASKELRPQTKDALFVTVYEGDHTQPAATCLSIGTMTILATGLARPLRKGTPITVTIEVSEDRTVRVTADLENIDQTFSDIFSPKARKVDLLQLTAIAESRRIDLDGRIAEAEAKDEFETAAALEKVRREVDEIALESSSLSADDASDKRYQLDERLRGTARTMEATAKDTRVESLLSELAEVLAETQELVDEQGNDLDKSRLKEAVRAAELSELSRSESEIREATSTLRGLQATVLWRTPAFLIAMFEDLSTAQVARFNDQQQARMAIEAGKRARQSSDWERLRDANLTLLRLLPSNDEGHSRYSTGLGEHH